MLEHWIFLLNANSLWVCLHQSHWTCLFQRRNHPYDIFKGGPSPALDQEGSPMAGGWGYKFQAVRLSPTGSSALPAFPLGLFGKLFYRWCATSELFISPWEQERAKPGGITLCVLFVVHLRLEEALITFISLMTSQHSACKTSLLPRLSFVVFPLLLSKPLLPLPPAMFSDIGQPKHKQALDFTRGPKIMSLRPLPPLPWCWNIKRWLKGYKKKLLAGETC